MHGITSRPTLIPIYYNHDKQKLYVKASLINATYKTSKVVNLFREISGVYYFLNEAVQS